jgi:hypothetical protein
MLCNASPPSRAGRGPAEKPRTNPEAGVSLSAPGDGAGGPDVGGEEDQRRIRRLVDKLHRATEAVARQVDASSFSISVGFPLGVGVSIDWALDPQVAAPHLRHTAVWHRGAYTGRGGSVDPSESTHVPGFVEPKRPFDALPRISLLLSPGRFL